MKNGPELWNKLLSESPPGSVLMGGAVVDYMFGYKPNDFDIFHTYKPMQMFVPPHWKLTKQDYNDPNWVAEHQEKYLQGIDGNGNHSIGAVNEYEVDIFGTKHLVQLIAVMYDKPEKHFLNFDHSLTLGKYNQAGLFIHREVYRALHDKEVRYVSKNFEKFAVEKSLQRAKNKVGQWTHGNNNHWKFTGFNAKEVQPQAQWGEINVL